MRSEKLQMLEVVKGLLQDKPALLIGFDALTVAQFSAFRAKLAEIGAECHIVKNTLVKKAAKALGYDELASQELSGQTALVSGEGDAVAMAKAIKDLIKESVGEDKKPRASMKGARVDGQVLGAVDMAALADLPPREVLLGQLLGLLQAPAGQMVRVLNAKLSSVVYVLNAFLKKKEQAA